MKKEDNSEKILLIIVSIVIIASIFFVVYSVFVSNSNISSNLIGKSETNNTSNNIPNSSENNSNSSGNNSNSSTSGDITEDEKNNMNVDPNKVPVKTPVETEIASFTSTLYDKDANRVHNITLADSKLNNAIIKKGEEFSFNNTIGPMGEEQGYKEAVGFDSEGDKIKVFGGGMCQISSTVYNAALIAGLEITERHPHSRRVYYVPKDKDATVFYGSLDLKFKNNTDGDIKILATNDNQNVTIKFIKIT